MTHDLPLRRGVLADQEVRQVGARELCRNTAEVIGSVVDGERIIVTRHGSPRAVVLSVRDAIELLVEPRLASIAGAGVREFREGSVEPMEPPGPHPVVLTREAAESYERMNRQDRSQLRVALVGGRAGEERPLWLRSRRWLVSISYPDVRTVLVLGACEVHELERELIGEAIWLARSRQDLERRLHARD